MQKTRKNSSEKETRGKEKERDERNERKLAVYRATLSHSPIRARIVPVRRSSFKFLFSLTPVVGGRAEKGDEVKKETKKEKRRKWEVGGWWQRGRVSSPTELLARDTRIRFLEHSHANLRASKYFSRVVGRRSRRFLPLPPPRSLHSLYFSFSLSSFPTSCKLPGPTHGAQMRWKR